MNDWPGVPENTRKYITALCQQGNADIRIGSRRWVSCWMCRDPVSVPMDFDYGAEKPVCSTGCAREKKEHYA